MRLLEAFPDMKQQKEPQKLHEFFAEQWHPSLFGDIWSSMSKVIDISRSSQPGRWFVKDIFVNLAVQMKLYLDTRSLADFDILSDFYDQLGENKNYSDIQRASFREVRARTGNFETLYRATNP